MLMKIKEKTVERWFDCRFFTWNWFVFCPLNGVVPESILGVRTKRGDPDLLQSTQYCPFL